MKRTVIQGAFCAVLGVVVSLGLALMLWIYLPMPDGPSMGQTAGSDPAWRVYLPEGWAEPEFVARCDRVGRSYWQGWNLGRLREAIESRDGEPVSPMYAVHVFHAGWPARCFEGAITWSPTYRPKGSEELRMGTVATPEWIPGRAMVVGWAGGGRLTSEIPLVVRWPGLALDAAVFGVFAWLAWWGCGRLRAHLRRRRGRCPACGYDVRGLGGCPECGPGGAVGGAQRPA